jgi:hypothetical protein
LKFKHYLIFLTLIDMEIDIDFLKKSLCIFLGVNVLLFILGMFSYLLPDWFIYVERLRRWGERFRGVLTHPIAYANFLSMISVSSLIFYYYLRDEFKTKVGRGIWLGSVLILLFGVVLTETRGVWLSTLVAFLFWIFLVTNWKERGILFFVGIVFISVLFFGPFRDSGLTKMVRSRIDSAITSQGSGRGLIYKIGYDMFKSGNMFFGNGTGFVKYRFGQLSVKLRKQRLEKCYICSLTKSGKGHLHSNYLQFLVEGGIVQLILFFWLVYEMIIKILPGFSGGVVKNPFFLGIALVMIVHLVSGIFEYNFFYANVSRPFWFFMGILFNLGFKLESGEIAVENHIDLGCQKK